MPCRRGLTTEDYALKTNYRNLEEAKRQAELLKTLIQTIEAK